MGEKSSEIKHQIDEERRSLGENLSELEDRAKLAVDWRSQVQQRPMTALGVALGAGAIIGALSVRSQSGYGDSEPPRFESHSHLNAEPRVRGLSESPFWAARKRKMVDILDTLGDAVMAAGIAKAKDFVGSFIPGLNTHLERAEREGRNGSG